ncbi:MAG TPA: RNA polymerase sigma-70 factor [Gemmatimonadaceae bacterium]|nr:RNA polymerase sigma-70 factor [Gemmatimonadaceae bacterium]
MADEINVAMTQPSGGTLGQWTDQEAVWAGEAALVARIQQGEVAAFEALFAMYYVRVRTAIIRYVRSPEVAEDLTQDVFAWVWAERSTWTVRLRVDRYLFGAARNRALNYLKRQGIATRYEERAIQQAETEDELHAPATPADDQRERELDDMVRYALERLPPRRRQAVTLRVVYGLSNSEVAQAMGVSVKAVEFHFAHGLKAVRAVLRAEFGFPGD